jgi:hypothetical protein
MDALFISRLAKAPSYCSRGDSKLVIHSPHEVAATKKNFFFTNAITKKKIILFFSLAEKKIIPNRSTHNYFISNQFI